jgi:hypothetical protein
VSSSDGEEVSPKSRVRGWFGNLSRTRKIATVIVTVAGGLVTVGTAIGMLFTVVAHLFPPPSIKEKTGATLSDIHVKRTMTLENYIRSSADVPDKVKVQVSRKSQEDRQRLGSIIRYTLELKGYAGERVSLKYSVIHTDTGMPVPGLKQEPAWPQVTVIPQSKDSENQYETWVPFPQNNEGPYSVSLEVYAPPIRGDEKKRIEVAEVTMPAERNEGNP